MAPQPLVSVFIDGLRPDWVEKMPFVRSVGKVQQLQTEFGYSIACHASMYTGASIQEHGHWFVWLRDSTRSAFPDRLRRMPKPLDNVASRLALRKWLVAQVPSSDRPRGFFDVPRLVHTPISQWPGLWVAEDRFWTEDGYAPVPTLFEMARKHDLRFTVRGLQRGGGHLKSVEQSLGTDYGAEWIYLFIGEVDHAAHVTGGEGAHFEQVIREADAAIEARCAEVEQRYGGYDFVLFSDHGHLRVEKYVDIYKRLDSRILNSTPHIVDTNFVRFWSKSGTDRAAIVEALERLVPEGRVLSEEELMRWECWFPDARYGDVIFYLDKPCAFSRTAWGYSRSQVSVHGYVPTIPEMNASFVTNMPEYQPVKLRDVFGVHTDRLGLG